MVNTMQFELQELSRQIARLADRSQTLKEAKVARSAEILRKSEELKALQDQNKEDDLQIEAIDAEAKELCIAFKSNGHFMRENHDRTVQSGSEVDIFNEALDAIMDDDDDDDDINYDDASTQNTSKTLTEDTLRQLERALYPPTASVDSSVNRERSPELGEVAGGSKRSMEEQVPRDRDTTMRRVQEPDSGRKNTTPKRRCTQKVKGYYFGMPKDDSEAYARNA